MSAKVTSSASENISIGGSSQAVASLMILQFEGTGWTGSIVIQGRIRGMSAPWRNIGYLDREDNTEKTAAITTDKLVEINAAGLEIRLVHTRTAGSVTLYYNSVLG